jgi:SAM-dependent methyltransferase
VFGEVAELYDRARPSYPAALVDDLIALVGAAPHTLDIGCGTGKASLLLADRGATGVGVEPHAAMAEIARRNLAGYPGWRIDIAAFEGWAPAAGDAPFDLVTCAQAWHWLDRDVRLHKSHALLRPGGWVALFWNTHPDDQPATELKRAIDEAYTRHAPGLGGLPRRFVVRDSDETRIPDELAFDAPIDRVYAWTQVYSGAEWLELLRTHSNHRMLPPDQLERLLGAVGEAINAHGGRYPFRYVTHLWAARRSL